MQTRCRLCSKEEYSSNLKDIFDEKNELQYLISKLLPVVVIKWDPLPHCVCFPCAEKLTLFDHFYNESLQAETVLRRMMPFQLKFETESLQPTIKISAFTTVYGHHLKHLITSIPPEHMSKQADPKLLGWEFASQEDELHEIVDIKSEDLGDEEKKENIFEDIKTEIESVSEGSNTPESFENVINCNQKSSKDFLITRVNGNESVFTCRQCSRTYTKESSAFTHVCVISDEKERLAVIKNIEPSESPRRDIDSDLTERGKPSKLFPPIKIRLVTSTGDYHICEFCRKSFSRKISLQAHQKKHFMPDSYDKEYKIKKKFKKMKSKYRDNGSKHLKKKKKHKKDGSVQKRALFEVEKQCMTDNRRKSSDKQNSNVNQTVNNESYVCYLCQSEFSSQTVFNVHVSHHINKVQTNPVSRCEIPSYPHSSDFNSNHSSEKIPYNVNDDNEGSNIMENNLLFCAFCNETYLNESDLMEHQEKHLKQTSENILSYSGFKVKKNKRKDYNCDQDSKSVKKQQSTDSVSSDIAMLANKPEPVCEKKEEISQLPFTLDYKLDSTTFLNQPSSSKTSTNDLHICNICNMAFSRRTTFLSHEKSHFQKYYEEKNSEKFSRKKHE